MRTCSISWEPIPDDQSHHLKGLKKLSPKLIKLNSLELSAEELRHEAAARCDKMSIQGVQPKLSAVLDLNETRFKLVDSGGRYILKPPHLLYKGVAENEALTMSLAKVLGFTTPLHGLLENGDQSKTYFVKRFDRYSQNSKLHQEDFAQLAGETRDTKYNSSMEKVVDIINQFCSFPAVERLELFKRVIFCYLTGNEDMHLKNFSIIIEKNIVKLSPVYDMLNTSIIMPRVSEEIALPLRGRKRNLSSKDLVKYFGHERCQIPAKLIDDYFQKIKKIWPHCQWHIQNSFLSEDDKNNYKLLSLERLKRLDILH